MECQTKKMGASFYPKRLHSACSKRSFQKDLTDEPSDSKDFKSATKFVSHCLEKLQKGEFDLEQNCCQNKYRVMGAGLLKKPLKYDVLYLIILLTLDIV